MTTPAYLLIPDSIKKSIGSRKVEQVINHDTGIKLSSVDVSAGTYIQTIYENKDNDGNPEVISGTFILFLDKKESDLAKKELEVQRKKKLNTINEAL